MITDRALAALEQAAVNVYRDSDEGTGSTTAALVSIAISLKRIADSMTRTDAGKFTRGGEPGC